LSTTFSKAEERKKGSPADTNSTTRYALAAARSRVLLVQYTSRPCKLQLISVLALE
jgi:hypothetical protein